MDTEFLKLLCCPETHQGLCVAEAALCDQLNAQIQAGSLHGRSGKLVAEIIQGGLVRTDGKFLYPIRHNIPVLLVEESIALPAI